MEPDLPDAARLRHVDAGQHRVEAAPQVCASALRVVEEDRVRAGRDAARVHQAPQVSHVGEHVRR